MGIPFCVGCVDPNMKKRVLFNSKVSALLLTTAMAIGASILPASAAEINLPFLDIAADSPYVDGIKYVYEEGISCGTSANTFSPDQPITLGELSMMLCRTYWPEKEWTFEAAINKVVVEEMGFVINPATEKYSPVSAYSAYEAVFSCLGIPVFGEELYNPDVNRSNTAVACAYTAARMNLCEEDSDPLRYITRGEVAQLLYQLKERPETDTVAPEIVNKLNVTIEEDYSTAANNYLQLVQELPTVILDQFEKSGWSLVIGNDYIAEWNVENNISAVGLTTYADKTIYTARPVTTIHELGHFLHHQLKRPSDVMNLYHEEAESARSVIGDYATTNEDEYFAEVFCEWFCSQNNETRRAELRAAAPKTFAYFSNLEANNWGLSVA